MRTELINCSEWALFSERLGCRRKHETRCIQADKSNLKVKGIQSPCRALLLYVGACFFSCPCMIAHTFLLMDSHSSTSTADGGNATNSNAPASCRGGERGKNIPSFNLKHLTGTRSKKIEQRSLREDSHNPEIYKDPWASVYDKILVLQFPLTIRKTKFSFYYHINIYRAFQSIEEDILILNTILSTVLSQ